MRTAGAWRSLGPVLFAVAACSGKGNDSASSDGAGLAGADGVSGDAGGTQDSTGSDGSSDGVAGASASSGTGAGGQGSGYTPSGWDIEEDCESVDVTADPVPPVFLFVVDKSGSMDRDDSPSTNGATKWEATSEALTAAFDDMPEEYAVGIVFYPNHDDCFRAPGGGLPVPIAPLDAAQVGRLQDAVEAQSPNSYTPTQDVMRYAYEQLPLAELPAAYDQSPRYVVLITDGVPTRALDCSMPTTGADSAEGIALPQYQGLVADVTDAHASGIGTFVIGVPGSEENHGNEDFDDSGDRYVARNMLSAMAVAGGNAAAGCNGDVAPMDEEAAASPFCHADMTQEADFVSALTGIVGDITTSVLDCAYGIPTPPTRILNPDPTTFVVEYTAGDSAEPEQLSYRTSSDCDDGWYVDGEQIRFCEGTCDRVREDAGGSVNIEFQCVLPQ